MDYYRGYSGLSTFRLYRLLGNAVDTICVKVDTICVKVDTINKHIDQVIEDAPTKMKVTVTLCDADWQKIQDMLNKQREWVINQSQTTVREVNTMLVEERKKSMSRYKEYDSCYLGHYAQWFFWFFFVLGFFIFDAAVVTLVGKWFDWF